MQHLCPHCGKDITTVPAPTPRSEIAIEQAFHKAYEGLAKTVSILRKLRDPNLHIEWRDMPPPREADDWRAYGAEAVAFHSTQDQLDVITHSVNQKFGCPYMRSPDDRAFWYRPKCTDSGDPVFETTITTWQQEGSLGYPFLRQILAKLFTERTELVSRYPVDYKVPYLVLFRYNQRETRGPLLISFYVDLRDVH
jgi:hypothetical protein